MSDHSNPPSGRRSFLSRLGFVAAGASVAAAVANTASAQTAPKRFEPPRHEEDAWLDQFPGVHRAYIDAFTGLGGVTAMNYANNILGSHADVYGGTDADYAMIMCFRGQATPLAWSDAIWTKYGAAFANYVNFPDPRTQQHFTVNPLMMADRADLPSRGNTLEMIAGRGVHYAVCNRATRSISTMVARATGGDAEAIYQELVASIFEGARMVPAGVLATTRAQEYGYSVLVAA